MIYRLFPFIFLFIACSSDSSDKSEEIVIVDTLIVSGTIQVDASMDQVQRYTIYAIYDGQTGVQGPTNNASSHTIQFDSVKIGIPQGHENGYVKFEAKVLGTKGTRNYTCKGSSDTFSVSLKFIQNVLINANSCYHN